MPTFPATASAASEADALLTGKTVLISEDDPEITHALTLRLKQLGVSVFRSPDAVGSLLAAHQVRPDLLILDVNIPGGNGLSVCEMLRSDPFYSHIPVIIHTGRADPQTIKRCQELGAYYVEKTTKSWPRIRTIICQTLGIKKEDDKKMEFIAAPSPDIVAPTQTAEDHCGERLTAPGTAPPISDLSSSPEEDLVSPENAASLPASQAPRQKQPLVLCIDDNDRLEALQELLEKQGVKTASAHSDQQGYWSCFSHQPDAIFISSDYLISKGREALARFEENSLTASLPLVIVATNNDHLSQVEDLVALGRPHPITSLTAERLPATLKEIMQGKVAFGASPEKKAVSASELPGTASRHATESESSPEESVLNQIERDFAFTREQGASSAAPAAEAMTEEASSANRPHQPPLVLCIDDDPEIARDIALRLTPYHVEVREAHTGMDGYWLGLKIIPDVIILDMEMPDGSGNYIFSRFKQHPLTKDIPILILTAHPSPGMKRELLGFGLEAFLLKPLNFQELLEVLKRHIYLEGITGQLPLEKTGEGSKIH